MKKRICKSTTDKKIAGVCGGIAEYFGIDSTWVRIAFCILAFCASLGIWPYIICALVFPKDTDIAVEDAPSENQEEPAPAPEYKKCEGCGSLEVLDAEFCTKCGRHFES